MASGSNVSDVALKRLVHAACVERGASTAGPKQIRRDVERQLGLPQDGLKPRHAVVVEAMMDYASKPIKRKREGGSSAKSGTLKPKPKLKMSQPKKKKSKKLSASGTAALPSKKRPRGAPSAPMSPGARATASNISETKLNDAKAYITELSNGSCSMDGWSAEVQQRNGGVSAGSFDCYFISPLGFLPVGASVRASKTKKLTRRRFRSRKDIARAFGLIVDTTTRGGGRVAPSVAGAPLNAGSWRQVNNVKSREGCHSDARRRLMRELGLINEVRTDPAEVVLWCRQTLAVLIRDRNAVAFLDDPRKAVKGYSKIIKKPMFLRKIKAKLESGKAYGAKGKGGGTLKKGQAASSPSRTLSSSRQLAPKSAKTSRGGGAAAKSSASKVDLGASVLAKFATDVRLVFDNCKQYNVDESAIWACADSMSKRFETLFMSCPLGTAPTAPSALNAQQSLKDYFSQTAAGAAAPAATAALTAPAVPVAPTSSLGGIPVAPRAALAASAAPAAPTAPTASSAAAGAPSSAPHLAVFGAPLALNADGTMIPVVGAMPKLGSEHTVGEVPVIAWLYSAGTMLPRPTTAKHTCIPPSATAKRVIGALPPRPTAVKLEDETTPEDPTAFTDHTETHLFPVGFRSRRIMLSATAGVPTMSWYESEIKASADGTRIFVVREISRCDPTSATPLCCVSESSAGKAWGKMVTLIEEHCGGAARSRSAQATAQAPTMSAVAVVTAESEQSSGASGDGGEKVASPAAFAAPKASAPDPAVEAERARLAAIKTKKVAEGNEALGLHLFGLAHPRSIALLEGLPGALNCGAYLFMAGIVHQKFTVYAKEAQYHEKVMDRLRYNIEKKHLLIEKRLMRAEEKACMAQQRAVQRAKDAVEREALRLLFKTARTTELAAEGALELQRDELKRMRGQMERLKAEGGESGPNWRPLVRAERTQQRKLSDAERIVTMEKAETESIISRLSALEPVSARSASDSASGSSEDVARARVLAWIEREDNKKRSEARAMNREQLNRVGADIGIALRHHFTTRSGAPGSSTTLWDELEDETASADAALAPPLSSGVNAAPLALKDSTLQKKSLLPDATSSLPIDALVETLHFVQTFGEALGIPSHVLSTLTFERLSAGILGKRDVIKSSAMNVSCVDTIIVHLMRPVIGDLVAKNGGERLSGRDGNYVDELLDVFVEFAPSSMRRKAKRAKFVDAAVLNEDVLKTGLDSLTWPVVMRRFLLIHCARKLGRLLQPPFDEGTLVRHICDPPATSTEQDLPSVRIDSRSDMNGKLRPCASCKSNKQGGIFCRLKMKHGGAAWAAAHRASIEMQAAAAAASGTASKTASGSAAAKTAVVVADAVNNAAAAVGTERQAEMRDVSIRAAKRRAVASASLDRAYKAIRDAAANETRKQMPVPVFPYPSVEREERTCPGVDYPLRLSAGLMWDALNGSCTSLPSRAVTEEVACFGWFAQLAPALTARNGKCAASAVKPAIEEALAAAKRAPKPSTAAGRQLKSQLVLRLRHCLSSRVFRANSTSAARKAAVQVVDEWIRVRNLVSARFIVEKVIAEEQDCYIFTEAVDLTLYTTYLRRVKKPMDLGLILSRLRDFPAWFVTGADAQSYDLSSDVAADVQLVFENCLRFNDPESDICSLAEKISDRFTREFSEARSSDRHERLELHRGAKAGAVLTSAGSISLKSSVATATSLCAPAEAAPLTSSALVAAAARHAIVWVQSHSSEGGGASWRLARVLAATDEGSGCFEWVGTKDPDALAGWPHFGEWIDQGAAEVRAACVSSKVATAAADRIAESTAKLAEAMEVENLVSVWPLMTTQYLELEREIAKVIASTAAPTPAPPSSSGGFGAIAQLQGRPTRSVLPPTTVATSLFKTATALGEGDYPDAHLLVSVLQKLCSYALDSTVIRSEVDRRLQRRNELRTEITQLSSKVEGKEELTPAQQGKIRAKCLVELGGRSLGVRTQTIGQDRLGNKYWWSAHAPMRAQQSGGGEAAVRGLHALVQIVNDGSSSSSASASASMTGDARALAPARWVRIPRGSGPGEADAEPLDNLIAYLQPKGVREGPLQFGLRRLARADASPDEVDEGVSAVVDGISADAASSADDVRPVLSALKARMLWLEGCVPDAVLERGGDSERQWASPERKTRLAWRDLVCNATSSAELAVALVVLEDALPAELRLNTAAVPPRGVEDGMAIEQQRASVLHTHTSAADVALRLHWLEFGFRRRNANVRASMQS